MKTIYDEAEALLRAIERGARRIAVATVSSCYGVLNLFEVMPESRASRNATAALVRSA
jgi:hypothetical protein